MEKTNQVTTKKIPDFIMLKMMCKERGQLLSYIEELEFEIIRLKSLSEKELSTVKKDELVKELGKKISSLEQAIKSYKRETNELKRQRDNLLHKSLAQKVRSIEPHVIF